MFYNTLFDENAACHLALGFAFPFCLEGGLSLSKEEQQERGLNQSIDARGLHDRHVGSGDRRNPGRRQRRAAVPRRKLGILMHNGALRRHANDIAGGPFFESGLTSDFNMS